MSGSSCDAFQLHCRESIVSDKWITDELESSDIGSYMGIPRNLLPEIFFEDELPPWEELHPRGGCRGLEVEFHAIPFMEAIPCVIGFL